MKKMLGLLVCVLALGCAERSTPTQPDIATGKRLGAINGWALHEILLDGCQYITLDRGIAHRGNCTNSFHLTTKTNIILQENYIILPCDDEEAKFIYDRAKVQNQTL